MKLTKPKRIKASVITYGIAALAAAGPVNGPPALAVDMPMIPTNLNQSLGPLYVPDVVEGGKTAFRVVNKVKDVLDVGQRIVAQLSFDVTLNVKYQPEDGPTAIHLRHDPNEDRRDRDIILEAKLEYKGDASHSFDGPIGYKLPKPGPVANKRVRFYIAPSTLKWSEIGEFDGGALPVWSSYTKADGIARGTLHPILEQPHLGGIKTVEEAEVRAKVQVQTGFGVPIGPIDLGAVIADEFLTTAEATGKIRIERHIPTEWTGTVEFTRNVAGMWSINKPVPPSLANKPGSWSTLSTGNEFLDVMMKITDVHLNEKGIGKGKYELKTGVSYYSYDKETVKTYCEEEKRLKTFTNTVEIKGSGNGEESGDVSVSIEVDTDRNPFRYAVVVDGPGLGMRALSPLGLSGVATWENKYTDCNGTHTKPIGYVPLKSKLGLEQVAAIDEIYPREEWLVLDPDATTLTGTLVWNDTPALGPDAPHLSVTNTLKWKLNRVIPEGLGSK